MTARTLMVQGTASSAGKSLLVTALCRLYHRRGLRVAPFKAQNMALNAAVTPDGLEIGRAQAVQAEAAGVAPRVEMNPILLKPEGALVSQVVVRGRAVGRMRFGDYRERRRGMTEIIDDCLQRLRRDFDLVILEGAGSPAEVNLEATDVANMFAAELADAPVVLVGDVDRGGVFASLVGTLSLLAPSRRARVKGLVVNKLRGDVRLFSEGARILEARAGLPVLGVVPWLEDAAIADEDSVALETRKARRRAEPEEIEVAVVRLPHLSNHDDVLPLEHAAGVVVRFVDNPRDLLGADLVIVPGSKQTVADLQWLRQRGLANGLRARAARGEPVLGICGGCQMLGLRIEDPEGVEGPSGVHEGLGVLPLVTRFGGSKRTTSVQAALATTTWLGAEDTAVRGYEIHHGRTTCRDGTAPALRIATRNGVPDAHAEGAVSGSVVGTMVHGLLDAPGMCAGLIASLRACAGLGQAPFAALDREGAYDRLADHMGGALDLERLDRIIEEGP